MQITATATPKRNLPSVRLLLATGALVLNSAAAIAAGPYAYLPSNFHSTYSAIDLSDTAAQSATVTVTGTANSTGFYGAALSVRDGKLYISDDFNEAVFQIDPATGTTLHKYVVGTNPRGIAVDQSGKHVYVANFASAGLSIIDTSANTVSEVDFGTLPGLAFAKPTAVALNLAGTRAYVTDGSTAHRLCRINTATPPVSLSESDCIVVGNPDDDGAYPFALALNPDGTRVYVVNHSESTISVVDTASFSVLRTFTLGYASPNGIAVSASGKRAYVGTSLGRVVVLDLTHADDSNLDPVLDVVSDDSIAAVQGVSISPDGTRLLAVDNTTSELHFINIVGDADMPVASVTVNQGPFALGQFTKLDAIFVNGLEKSN